MIDPILRVRLTIQCSALDVDVLVRRVEVDVFDAGRLTCHWAGDVDGLKVRWDDQVHVLAWVAGR